MYLVFVFSLSNFMKWSVVYAASLCSFVRFETMIWPSIRFDISLQNFNKPLDIFSPQIERKRSEEYLVITLAVKRKLWAIFLPRVHLCKSKHWVAGLKHKLKLYALRLRIFRDTLILVVVYENCCLCKCFTKLYFFYWLLVVSLAILIAVPFAFSRSDHEHRLHEYSKCRAYQTLFKLHIVIKALNKNINIINSLLCWNVFY